MQIKCNHYALTFPCAPIIFNLSLNEILPHHFLHNEGRK